MSFCARSVSALLIGTTITCATQANIRDYYEEPGLNPFKQTINQNFAEHIDPFSGQLQLSYTDILVPGNGGFDLKVHRVYNNPQDAHLPYSPYGYGWNMHFGRIAVPQEHNGKVCTQQIWSVDVLDNPSLELPDGGRQLLVLADQHGPELITKQWWSADCEADGDVVVKSPDGTKYVMDEWDTDAEGTKIYATYIEDANGNSMTIDYNVNATGVIYINTVTTSDGRSLSYAYDNLTTDNIRLKSISVKGGAGSLDDATWTYNHTYTTSTIPEFAQLTKVTRPDGRSWDYSYHPNYTDGTAGSLAVDTVSYPSGGTIAYDYNYVYFDTGAQKATTVVSSKQTGGRDITPGTWSFSYTPGYASGSGYDETLMVAPDHQRLFHHVGYTAQAPRWRVGTKDYETIYDLQGNPQEQFAYIYGSLLLSNEDYWHGRDTRKRDSATLTPYVANVRHWRHQTAVETQYSNFNAYGQPQTTVETSNYTDIADRTISKAYQNITTNGSWILGLVTQEVVEQQTTSPISQWTTTRSFDNAGNLLSEDKWGVQTTYTYTSEGDISTVTDARNNVTTYSNYFRGSPRSISYPENVSESHVINNDGTLASSTNGRGHTTYFTWDDLNRLTGIDYPINADVSIAYADDRAVLTRGAYKETSFFDGFWRSLGMERQDVVTGETVAVTKTRSAIGKIDFEGYPNSIKGISKTYNAIEQLTSITYPDQTSKTFAYPYGFETVITDENGNTTVKRHISLGSMDNTFVTDVRTPELVTTIMRKDGVWNTVEVVQGEHQPDDTVLGLARNYDYDTRGFLVAEQHPETGTTQLGRDEVGNLTSIEIGTSGIVETRTYDGLNRLETVSYSDGTPTATYSYNLNSNVTSVTSSVATRTYSYDANDNLVTESLQVDSNTYDVAYTINALDQADALTYPSGRQVDFDRNALGWQTKAGAYVTYVDHHPTGAVSSLTFGNGVLTNVALDNRLRPASRTSNDGQSNFIDLQLDYNNAGNLKSIVDNIGTLHDRTIGYDDFGRMTSATGPWGTETVTYDALSNITSRDRNGVVQDYYYIDQKLAYRAFPDFYYVVTHDAHGNMTSDGENLMVYDGAGRQVSAQNGLNIIDYQYDGAGTRVSRSKLLTDEHILYGQGGNLLGEYNPAGGYTEYVYVDGETVAKIEDPTAVVGQ